MKLYAVAGLGAFLPVIQAASVSVPSSVPNGASSVVSKEFLSLGIESWSLVNYTGTKAQPNTFSLNLFKALTSRTGAVPIRLGGDSMDLVHYDPDQNIPITWPGGSKPSNLFSPSTFGKPYLESFPLIDGARWVIQVPLLRNNLSNAILWAQSVLNAIPTGSFEAIEMGNEPEEYPSNAMPEFGTWGIPTYDKAVANWTAALNAQVTTLPRNRANFWVLSGISGGHWPVRMAFDDGLSNEVSEIRAVSEHFYQANGTKGAAAIAESLLNHSATVKALQDGFGSPLSFLNTTSPPIPLILGEVAASMSKPPDSSVTPVQATFSAGIWTVDMMLHAMVIGIQRVNMQQIDTGFLSSWIPVPGGPLPPMALGAFYGELLIADIFNGTKGNLRVAELPVTDGSNIVAYSTYDSGKLNTVVVLNENAYLSDSKAPRGKVSVTVTGLGSARSVKVDHLSGAFADTFQNMTWAGQEWLYENQGVPKVVKNDTQTIAVSGGSVIVEVEATEGLLLSLQQ